MFVPERAVLWRGTVSGDDVTNTGPGVGFTCPGVGDTCPDVWDTCPSVGDTWDTWDMCAACDRYDGRYRAGVIGSTRDLKQCFNSGLNILFTIYRVTYFMFLDDSEF